MTVDSHNAQIRRRFGASAEAYVASVGHATGSDLDRVVELAATSADTLALDIATGGGHTARAIAARAGTVIATDLVPRMVGTAARSLRERGVSNVRFAVANASALPFCTGAFELVTCRIAPHHFEDPAGYAREVARVLRPGGRLVMVDSVGDDDPALDAILDQLERRRDPTHVRSYQLDRWHQLLQDAGLTVDHVETFVRTHVWEDWVSRSPLSPAEQRDLEAYLLTAPSEFRTKYGVKVDGAGRVESWSDVKAIVRAVKPA